MTGGQDWASELIETGGKEVKEDDLVKLVEAAGALFRWLEAFERRVQELELKNTCFGPLKPSGSSAAEAIVKCAEQVAALPTSGVPTVEFSRQAAYIASQKADKPKREWWVVFSKQATNGIAAICLSEDEAINMAEIFADSSICRVITAPTDAEIEEAVKAGRSEYLKSLNGLSNSSAGDCIRHAINHLLGRAKR